MRTVIFHRYHGQTIIKKLALHKDFMNLWMKIVPEKDRRPVEKSLKKANNYRQQVSIQTKLSSPAGPRIPRCDNASPDEYRGEEQLLQ